MPSWSFALTFALPLTAILYARGWYLLHEALPEAIPASRLAAFMAGLLAVWAVLGSPIAHLDHRLLTAHMVQHLVLMTVAAPLLLVGAPAVALLQGFPPPVASRLIRAGRSTIARGIGRVLAHPVVCWLAGTGVVVWWHVPRVFALGMSSESWHGIEQTSFLIAGLLFWWPVIQPWPSLARWPEWSVPLYLFLATIPCDALSAFLTFCGNVVYSSYLSGSQSLDVSALRDQERGGALMWIWVTFAYLIPAAGITIRMLSPRLSASRVEVA